MIISIDSQPNCSEFKAIALIVLWATFTLNIDLVRILWQFHGQPIRLLLNACNALHRLKSYVADLSVQGELDKHRQELGDIATGLLELCNNSSLVRCDNLFYERASESEHKSRQSINRLIPFSLPEHYNDQLVCDVAANAHLHSFLAHEATQRWLSDIYSNGMHLRRWSKRFKIPEPLLLLSCLILYVPSKYCVYFPHPIYDRLVYAISSSTDISKTLFSKTAPLLATRKSPQHRVNRRPSCKYSLDELKDGEWAEVLLPKIRRGKVSTLLQGQQNVTGDFSTAAAGPSMSTGKCWKYLAFAPVTKFWFSQLFYFLYLALFTSAVLQPSCGNFKIDVALFAWHFWLQVENIIRFCRITSRLISIRLNALIYLEMPVQTLFLLVFTWTRLIQRHDPNVQYYVRMFMCVILLLAYIRYVATYTPLHRRLGPLFYYLKLMSLRDSLLYLAVVAPVMISFAVAIQVSLYPDLDFDRSVMKKMFYRSGYSLWLSMDDELVPQPDCKGAQCANGGIWSYLFVFTFLMLLRLIMNNLLSECEHSDFISLHFTSSHFISFHFVG